MPGLSPAEISVAFSHAVVVAIVGVEPQVRSHCDHGCRRHELLTPELVGQTNAFERNSSDGGDANARPFNPKFRNEIGGKLPGYLQNTEFKIRDIEKAEALSKAMQAERDVSSVHFTRMFAYDRNRSDYYWVIVEFDSYDDALRNAKDPVTKTYAEAMGAMIDRDPVFHDLDIRFKMDL